MSNLAIMSCEILSENPTRRFVDFINERRLLGDEYFQDIESSRVFLQALGGTLLRALPVPAVVRLSGGYLPTQRSIVLQSIDRGQRAPYEEIVMGSYKLQDVLELDSSVKGSTFWRGVAKEGIIKDVRYERKSQKHQQPDIYVGIRHLRGLALYDVNFRPPEAQIFDWLDFAENRMYCFAEFPSELKEAARWRKQVTLVFARKTLPES